MPKVTDGATKTELTYQQQARLGLVVAAPVSNTVYPVLAATANVQVIILVAYITWAVTQPTNLRIIVTIDGLTKIFTVAAPTSVISYFPQLSGSADASLPLGTTVNTAVIWELSGRSVAVDIAVTWAITQPTNLTCVLKYAKR